LVLQPPDVLGTLEESPFDLELGHWSNNLKHGWEFGKVYLANHIVYKHLSLSLVEGI
jgi:hypothetical protein